MGFPKGNNANPLGRGTETEKQRKNAAMLLSPYAEKAAKRIQKSLESEHREDHQWAVNLIMSYVFGKPKQEVDMTSMGEKIGILYVGTPKADIDITPTEDS